MVRSQPVSVIIPLYNEAELVNILEERLTTALAEETDIFEIVIVDDGSTDGTLEKLIAWHKRDPRVVLLQLSRNWGHQAAFNAGLDHATGDAIVLMDGDL